MSIIMQRRSNPRSGMQQEPLLPGASVSINVGGSTPAGGSGATGAELLDRRPFFKLRPSMWGRKQWVQLLLFCYACVDVAVAATIKRQKLNFEIQYFEKSNQAPDQPLVAAAASAENGTDVVKLGSFLFLFEGILYLALDLFMFQTFLGLVEREINPFQIINQMFTNAVIFTSYQVYFGNNKFLDIGTTLFFCVLTPMMALVIEHILFYVKSLARLNARAAVRVELLLPVALYIATQMVMIARVSSDSTILRAVGKNAIVHSFDVVAALYAASTLCVIAWTFSLTSYKTMSWLIQALTFCTHAVFVKAFAKGL
jgi:hypothetical protein